MKRSPGLDALRGIAILAVIAHHSGADAEGIPAGVLRYAFQAGWAGVDLFFAISGFLVCGILLRVSAEPGSWWATFAERRIRRILPLYALLVLLPVGILTVFGYRWAFSPWAFLGWANLPLAVVGGGVPFAYTWSLALEEQFYLLAAGLFALRLNRTVLLSVLGTLIVGCPIVRACVWDGGDATYTLPWCRLDAVAWGCLAAVAVREGWPLAGVGRVVACALGLLAVLLGAGVVDHHTWAVAVPGLSLLAATGAGLVALLASGQWSWSGRLADASAHAGQRCFGLYLIHPLVLPLVWRGFGGLGTDGMLRPVATFFVTTVVALALAEVSWRRVESPWIEAKPPGRLAWR